MGIEAVGELKMQWGAPVIFVYLLCKVLACGRPFDRLWELPVEALKTNPHL